MKQLFTFLILLAALAVRADLTPTNSVKISALSSATTPLTGNETVPLVQSGATKSATVSQLIAAATSQASASSNALQSQITANAATAAANTATASNYLFKVAGTNTTLIFAVSNYFATVTAGNAASTVTASNLLWLAIVTNTTAITAINAAGYQSAGQVSTAVNSAIAAAIGGVTNSGTINATNILTPPGAAYSYSSNAPVVIDLSRGSMQSATLLYYNNTISFSLTNAVSGQNVSMVVLRTGGMSANIAFGSPPNGFNLFNTAPATIGSVSPGKTILGQVQVFGTNIVFTMGTL